MNLSRVGAVVTEYAEGSVSVSAGGISREPWTVERVLAVMEQPFLELVYHAATVHRTHHDPRRVQISSLISIKTGGCPEDCSYCPQAARYATGVKKHGLVELPAVLEAAEAARAAGASRLCMGAAWRQVRDNQDFDRVLTMVKEVAATGLEVCCTLGMLSEAQARRLEEAGLYAYNHNVDSSPEFYKTIISTRTYDDRLATLKHVGKTKIGICSGGIIGMGESLADRAGMLAALAGLNPQPESVPINTLVPVEGTPLAAQEAVAAIDLIRMVATARIVLPRAMVRLSAGRLSLASMEQALCFLAGANSIFSGDKLLTTPNPDFASDHQLLTQLGLLPLAPYAKRQRPIAEEPRVGASL